MKKRAMPRADDVIDRPLPHVPNTGEPRHTRRMAPQPTDGQARVPLAPRNHGIATLRCGMRGDDVLQLQSQLAALGYPLLPDGEFGPDTRKAVFAFQRHQGLSQNGVAGPETVATAVSAYLTQIAAIT